MKRAESNAILAQLPAPPSDAVFKLRKVDIVSLPHPFVIGSEHLGNGTVNTDKPCHHCKKPASDHVQQKTLFIQVPQNKDLNAVQGLHAYLLEIKDKATALGIDGFAFPDKEPSKFRGWISKKDGMGGFLEPPGHPDHYCHLAYGKDSGASISSVIEDEDGEYADHLAPDVLKQVQELYAQWERTKPPIDHPRTLAWMQHAYAHFAHCYKDDKAEAEPFEYGRPATLIFPVPYYKLRQFRDDPRFSEEWRVRELAVIKQENDEIKAKYAKVCTPENYSAVRLIRRYYPEHEPRLDWIATPPQQPGNWYEELETQPTPDNCPGDMGHKHPVNGSWCQFCGWYAPKEAPVNAQTT